MKITKTHLTRLIKEEMSKISEMQYAMNQETGRWEDVSNGASTPVSTPTSTPASVGPKESIEDAIQMLESVKDVSGTLYQVIERLHEALEKL